MRVLLFRGFVVAAVIAAVAVPTAAAKSRVYVRLSVLPLPAASFGPAARSLPLELDSGVITNRNLRAFELPTTPNRLYDNGPFEPSGRVRSYALDYGDGTSGSKGVSEVWTSVDEYKTSADASSGVAFWRVWDRRGFAPFLRTAFSVTTEREKAAAALGRERFAVLVSYRAANIAPLFGLDEQFSVGRYEADVTVWAGTAATAEKLAPTLAERLQARIERALAGRLQAKPVKLPGKPKAGPAPGGPDLAPLALQPSDVSGPATGGGKYLPVGFGASFYNADMSPAGQFSGLRQEIFWWPTANEASFYDDDYLPPGDSLDLSSIGDGARGVLLNGTGPNGSQALVVFCSGQLEEVLGVSRATPLTPSQVKSVAQTAANKINAAGLGS